MARVRRVFSEEVNFSLNNRDILCGPFQAEKTASAKALREELSMFSSRKRKKANGPEKRDWSGEFEDMHFKG